MRVRSPDHERNHKHPKNRYGCKILFSENNTDHQRRRDQQDSSRAAAPLRKADDAVLIDSTNLTFEQTVDAIKKLIVQRAAALSLSI